jgi:hypothetical protein
VLVPESREGTPLTKIHVRRSEFRTATGIRDPQKNATSPTVSRDELYLDILAGYATRLSLRTTCVFIALRWDRDLRCVPVSPG